MGVVLLFLLILLLVLLAHIVALVWIIGLGWLLTLFLPFTLFEGALLIAAATGIVLLVSTRLFKGIPLLGDDDDDDLRDWSESDDFVIPESRFYKKEADKTWEAWIRFEFSNSIYDQLEEAPRSVTGVEGKQLQGLAIRLADIGVAILKRKSKVKQLKVTVGNLRQEMIKMDQRPYDNDILRIAAEAISEELQYAQTIDIVREQVWDDSCDMFD